MHRTLDRRAQALSRDEFMDVLDLEADRGAVAAGEHDREKPGGIAEHGRVCRIGLPARVDEGAHIGALRQRDVVEDVDETHADVVAQAGRQGLGVRHCRKGVVEG